MSVADRFDPTDSVLHADDQERVHARDRRRSSAIPSARAVPMLARLRRADGEYRWVEFAVSNLLERADDPRSRAQRSRRHRAARGGRAAPRLRVAVPRPRAEPRRGRDGARGRRQREVLEPVGRPHDGLRARARDGQGRSRLRRRGGPRARRRDRRACLHRARDPGPDRAARARGERRGARRRGARPQPARRPRGRGHRHHDPRHHRAGRRPRRRCAAATPASARSWRTCRT